MSYDDREQIIAGADYTYVASIKISASDPLVLAFYTIKTDPSVADPGTLQKKVTTTNAAGTGQITDTGATNGIATIRFDLTAANTTALPSQQMLFDVKAKTSSGAFAYGAQGRITVTPNITTSTS